MIDGFKPSGSTIRYEWSVVGIGGGEGVLTLEEARAWQAELEAAIERAEANQRESVPREELAALAEAWRESEDTLTTYEARADELEALLE